MDEPEPLGALLQQRKRLLGRIQQQSEQLEAMQKIVENLAEQQAQDERMLHDIDSVLGKSPQMQLEDADLLLRGRRLEEVAVQVLTEERGTGVEVHYQEWFELLRSQGHLIAGKEPLNTFLTQINRSEAVERVGRRTGRYRLIKAVA
jgi:microcystin degradation protein MlrC